ncbi:MAG: FAD-binding oxidoreductase [Bdellovibrionales bacterium]
MARTLYKCRLKEIHALTDTMRELRIDVLDPKGFQFQSGQFLMLQVPVPGQDKPAPRAYSIASDAREKDKPTLLIKLFPQGKASDFVRQLKGGEELSITGPFGRLFFQSPIPPQVLMLCTGAGLSQHIGFLRSHAHQFGSSKVTLLLGVWNEKEMFYQKELEEIKKIAPTFNYEFVLDKPLSEWTGKRGFVTDYLKDYDLKTQETLVYLCGNPAMIKNAQGILKDELQFDPKKIFAEAFH